MVKIIENFVDETLLKNLWGSTVCQRKWGFGQVSDDTIQPNYPMWAQHFYDSWNQTYVDEPHLEFVKELGTKFMALPEVENFNTLIRIMLSGNTFGQDGDIHIDWPVKNESITGVLYLNRNWEDNWGGETLVYNEDGSIFTSKLKAGNLLLFDSALPHIGKGPQRRCGELRSIIAIQAMNKTTWDNHVKKIKEKKHGNSG